ncbi:hypothetical protein AB0B89_13410 [Sphaerisporangium sp. NPDC049002]|uniref:hypothetical protein n=1 Tax=unclassified Sphaerisporangium TaxID=2630420 RepID=UPI0033CA2595
MKRPERLWTAFVPPLQGGASPDERARVPGGSYAASAPGEGSTATTRAGRRHGGRAGDASSGATRKNGPITPAARDRREGPRGRVRTLPDQPKPPAPIPKPPPRPSPPDPPRSPPSPEPRRPEADRPPPVPNPCATFTDFRRAYCDRLLSGHTGTK